MSNESLTITLVQADTAYSTIGGNLAHLEELMDKFEGNSDVFLLPELFNTGYQLAFSTRPESIGLQTTRWMQQMAKRKNAAIAGSISITENGKVFNRMLLVEPDGTIQHYDKINVFKFSGEDKVFSPGQRDVLFHFRGWKLKPVICFDLRFPETIRNRQPWYDAILCSAHWPKPRIWAWDQLLIARAIENQCFVAAVNRFGQEGEIQYPGHSVALDFLGHQLEATQEKEDMVSVVFLRDSLLSFRDRFPFLAS